MWTRCLGWFSVMWVTKLLISPVKKKDFWPKNDQIWPKIDFLFNLGQAMQAYSVPCWWVSWWLRRAGCISQDTYLLYSIFININYRIGKGQYSTDSGNWQTVSPLAKVWNHSPLQFFFLFFNTRLDYICAFILFPEWSLHRSSSTPCWRWTPARDWPPIRSFHIRCIFVGLDWN